ncbi:hypothetical protein ILUMI_20801 [Ignelater luminosus]|uniref:Uncharacterized protein n=1 Tax=Ignelater luminosus TaxID=2038154 RepID=A0A8K0G4J3_IGNLU|nr:hypothetical protein ILUMI_20801 [Ignelater luminosus]
MEKPNSSDKYHELNIDKVLSTQPELGPNIPDGGYGWIIMLIAAFFQALIPSLSVGFGIFVLFWRLENNAPLDPYLWDSKIVHVSLLFIAVSTAAEPWSRILSTSSSWPRLVTTGGTCLTCAGLLIIWLAINNSNRLSLFLLAGVLSGTGASIVLSQMDILISQYFRLKLESVRAILDAVNALGFILTPVALGHNIVKLGILQVITWYQAVILQGILIGIALRKPKYLKSQKTKYKLIRGISDDEEDIFAKNITELQNPRPINNSTNSNKVKVEVEVQPTCSNSKENRNHKPSSVKSNWEKFDEETSDTTTQKSKTHINLHNTFATDFNSDLNRIDRFEEINTEFPTPLFSETSINNNTSYSYETATEASDPVVFMPITKPVQTSTWKENVEFLKQPTFYKSLLLVITTKYSVFIFWTLYPTYLYTKIDSLKVNHTTVIVGCIGIGSLLFTTLAAWIKANPNIKAFFLGIFCWMGATGYAILANTQKETALIFAGIDVTLSLSALQILGMPLLKLNIRGETNNDHTALSVLTGIFLILLFAINMSYENCFRLMAILQFLTGSLWFSNFIYKKIKKKIIQN